MEVTRKSTTLDCTRCNGSGVVSVYHNDVEECERCNGSGNKTGEVALDVSEMRWRLLEAFPGRLSASDMFQILEIYDRWKEAK